MSLKGKIAFITGGGSGLGVGIADALTEQGADIVLADIALDKAEAAAEALRAKGFKAYSVKMDITDYDDVKAAMDKAEEMAGSLDILINNAGLTKMQNIEDIREEDWDIVFDINVRGTFRCCQVFADLVKARKGEGRIVNIASNAAKVTFPGQAHYNASKAAIVNMTQSLAKELAPTINVNAVCPGAIDTAMLRFCMDRTIEDAPEDEKPTIEELRMAWGPSQIKRLIQPIEVGRIVAFLASDAAYIIRGQSISIDAGNTPY
ncbi:MAG: SDR family oxidoreductase [Dorea sp.]|nr:SDR family oxidoreductase [Dorea sp.]